MVNLNPVVLIIILVACVIIALLLGYVIGSRLGVDKSTAMKEEKQRHDSYKNEVREHFEHTSAIMSRMVDDYRDMYQHMSQGAEQLADMHPEKLVTPPPAPEAITSDDTVGEPADHDTAEGDRDSAAGQDKASTSTASNSSHDAVMKSDSSNDRPWNKEGGDKKYGLA